MRLALRQILKAPARQLTRRSTAHLPIRALSTTHRPDPTNKSSLDDPASPDSLHGLGTTLTGMFGMLFMQAVISPSAAGVFGYVFNNFQVFSILWGLYTIKDLSQQVSATHQRTQNQSYAPHHFFATPQQKTDEDDNTSKLRHALADPNVTKQLISKAQKLAAERKTQKTIDICRLLAATNPSDQNLKEQIIDTIYQSNPQPANLPKKVYIGGTLLFSAFGIGMFHSSELADVQFMGFFVTTTALSIANAHTTSLKETLHDQLMDMNQHQKPMDIDSLLKDPNHIDLAIDIGEILAETDPKFDHLNYLSRLLDNHSTSTRCQQAVTEAAAKLQHQILGTRMQKF